MALLSTPRPALRSYGPLSLAVAPLVDTTRPRPMTEDAAFQLSRLLDFHGSVELAALVGKPLAEADASTLTPDAGQRVRAELVEDLGEVRAQLVHGFSRWTAQKSRIAGPEVLVEALAPRATLGFRERRTTTIATEVWTPIAEEALKELTQARRSVRRLRLELEPSLVILSPLASRLCELNHTLSEALEPAVHARMERIISAAQTHLVRELAVSIGSMPAGDPSQVVAEWLSHGGPIRQGIALFARLAKAGLELEERRVLALVDAVLESDSVGTSMVQA